jgi:hypothetical protein
LLQKPDPLLYDKPLQPGSYDIVNNYAIKFQKALECVRKDFAEIIAEIKPAIMPEQEGKQELELTAEFLRDIACQVDDIIQRPEARKAIRSGVEEFADMFEEFGGAYNKHVAEVKKHQPWQLPPPKEEDTEDGKHRDEQEPKPPKKVFNKDCTWDAEFIWGGRDCVGCWVPDVFPVDPSQWLPDCGPPAGVDNYYLAEIYAHQRYPQRQFTQKPDREQILMIQHVLLAIIHDACLVDRGIGYDPIFWDMTQMDSDGENWALSYWKQLSGNLLVNGTKEVIEKAVIAAKNISGDKFLGDKTANLDEPPAGTGQDDADKFTEDSLTKAPRVAYATYEYAITKNVDLANATDDEVYQWLKSKKAEEDSKLTDYELQDCESWKRQLRKARKFHGTQKHKSRAGRNSNAQDVKKDPELLPQISNQYNKTD